MSKSVRCAVAVVLFAAALPSFGLERDRVPQRSSPIRNLSRAVKRIIVKVLDEVPGWQATVPKP
jgi:hypothetical protein